MAQLISVEEQDLIDFRAHSQDNQKYCASLESGNILFFPKTLFAFPQEDLDFLLAQKQTGSAHRKNIAYKPEADKITNFVKSSKEQELQLLNIMRNYSKRATLFLTQLLNPYASHWNLDYASFRPFQEKGRPLRLRARNDLLHVDSFPTRPMHGNRILRFFTNINPNESRYWTTSLPFEQLATLFGGKALPFPSSNRTLFKKIKEVAHSMGLPITLRSPYDTFMLSMHNFLKENDDFQKNCPKDYWVFPPNSCWAVYTDQVSHAATAGQYAIEQTFIIPRSALINPEKSPIGVLEKLMHSKGL